MAKELEAKEIPAIVLYPGAVSTEFIRAIAGQQNMDLSQSQTPLLVGRSITSLLTSEDLMARTGTIQWVEDLIEEFDLVDENGGRPTEKYAARMS